MTAPAAQAGLPGSGAAPAATGNKSTQTNAASEPLSGAVNTQTIPHTVKRGESVASLARHYLAESAFMQRSDLENAVRQANGLRADALQPGETVTIPGIPVQPILDKPVPIPKDFEVRGIYLTGYTAGSAHGLDLLEKWKALGGNAVVFDVKDYDGEVRFRSNIAMRQAKESRSGIFPSSRITCTRCNCTALHASLCFVMPTWPRLIRVSRFGRTAPASPGSKTANWLARSLEPRGSTVQPRLGEAGGRRRCG